MTTISDLPGDLVEDVLSRVPLTSLRAVRFTCTKWNTVSKNPSFTKKQIGQAKKKQTKDESLVIMTKNDRAYLMSVNLHGIGIDNVESSIQLKGTLISLTDGDRVVKSFVSHCDGLLLCITKDSSRLVVWNPYCGQQRWIEPRNAYHRMDNYALGYDSHRCHKILRYLDAYDESVDDIVVEFEIYNFDSNSWKIVEVPLGWSIRYRQRGVSLKGNTYFIARDINNIPQGHGEEGIGEVEPPDFLICFDFTSERFGPRLPLPFHSGCEDAVIISSVREEQIAVLFQNWMYRYTEIWISSKIEPNAVSWSKLLLDLNVREIPALATSFFVDQENKVAVVYSAKFIDRLVDGNWTCKVIGNTACIIRENGYCKQVDLRESINKYSFPFECSFVPSQVQITPQGKRKRDQQVFS